MEGLERRSVSKLSDSFWNTGMIELVSDGRWLRACQCRMSGY